MQNFSNKINKLEKEKEKDNNSSDRKIEIIDSPLSEDNNNIELRIDKENLNKPKKDFGEIHEIYLNSENIELSRTNFKNVNIEKIDISDDEINEENFQTEKKVVYSFFFFYLITILTNIIICLILSLNTNYDISDLELDFYKKIGNNWSLNLISEIKLNNCTDNDNLIKDYWPGENKGCNCGNGIIYIECPTDINNNNNIICNKTIIPEKEPIKYKLWRGEKICGFSNKEYKNKTYFDLDIQENSTKCDENKKSCGIIDTFNNILCINKLENCPILDIKFKQGIYKPIKNEKIIYSNDPNYNYNYINNNIINNNNNFTIVINNNPNDFPNGTFIPLEFKISENKPCMNPYYKEYNYTLYPLDKYYGKNECKEFINNNNLLNIKSKDNSIHIFRDDNFNIIDSIDKKKFYEENKIQENLKYPYGEKMNLYVKPYIGMNINCYKDFKKNNKGILFIKKIFDAKNREISPNNSFFFNLISLILSLFLCFRFFETTEIFYISIIMKRKIIEEGSKIILIGYAFISFGLSGGVILSIYNYQRELNTVRFKYLFDEKCFDSFSYNIQRAHDIYLSILDNAIRINMGFSWIFLYLILGYLFILSCSIFKSLK
jgi:hypothetical protein